MAEVESLQMPALGHMQKNQFSQFSVASGLS